LQEGTATVSPDGAETVADNVTSPIGACQA